MYEDNGAKQQLTDIKTKFNCVVTDFNRFLEKLIAIQKDNASDEEKLVKIIALLNPEGLALKNKVKEMCDSDVADIPDLKKLSSVLNDQDYKKIENLWDSDVNCWVGEIFINITGLELMVTKKLKIKDHFPTTVYALKEIQIPPL